MTLRVLVLITLTLEIPNGVVSLSLLLVQPAYSFTHDTVFCVVVKVVIILHSQFL